MDRTHRAPRTRANATTERAVETALAGPVECPSCGDWNPRRHVETRATCRCCGADLDPALDATPLRRRPLRDLESI